MRSTIRNSPGAMRGALVAVCGAVLALALPPGASTAGEPQSKHAKQSDDVKKKPDRPALDDALLKDLDNELLEGAGDLKTAPKTKPPEPGRAADKPSAPHDESGEDIGAGGQDEDLLARISQEMRLAETLIPKQAKRGSAEQAQRRIVEDLAALIEQAEKQRAQQSSSSKDKKSQKTGKRQMVQQPKPGQGGKDSNKPAKDSTDRLGKAEDAKPDPRLLKEMMKDSWGHLPQRAREQMSQNWPEQFLPQYELMIERFYKRLAQEQSSK